MTTQEQFWSWFVQHEAQLFDLDPSREEHRERLFDELGNELQKVDPDLAFEFGPNEPRREFVVSAGGIKRAFPAVAALVDAAPPLDRWQVTAFRPRRTPSNIVEFRGKRVDPKGVFSSHCWITERPLASIRSFQAFRRSMPTGSRSVTCCSMKR